MLSCEMDNRLQAQEPPSHELLNQLLKDYVVEDAFNYQGLKRDSLKLNSYLKQLSSQPPSPGWSENEELAYWINAYNAFTLKLIVDNYPIKSITDLHPTIHIPVLNTVWHKKFFKIGGELTSLDEIEHQILRKKFDEPRIHFAINCASVSCPPLRNEAYVAEKLDIQLNEQARNFINDSTRNKLMTDNPEISKIFSWFSDDFKKDQNLIDYLNQYSNIKISQDADLDYLEYDWSLNDVH